MLNATMAPRHPLREPDESGFTLIEALIALVISGILASALVSLLIGQSRFYERTDDQMYAEQSLRASMDLVATELRMGAPDDLVAAQEDSVTIRFDVIRGIVCDTTGADAVTAFAFERITDANIGGGAVGTAMSGPYDEPFTYADAWLPTESATGSGPKTSCLATGAPAGLSDDSYAVLTGWTSGMGVRPDPGSVLRFYGSLTYRFAPSTFFATRTALWRGRPFRACSGTPTTTPACSPTARAGSSPRAPLPRPDSPAPWPWESRRWWRSSTLRPAGQGMCSSPTTPGRWPGI